jgi:DICT domain-containing protein
LSPCYVTYCYAIRYRRYRNAIEPMDLTTAQLADRTGIPQGTLRVWQTRYGFPHQGPEAGSRHRYSETDVRTVEEVLRLRDEGVSMPAAIARARAALDGPPPSIYAGLRQRRAELRPQVLPKRALLELTHAIEDEHAAHAGGGMILASFQKAAHYRASEHRWRELARPVSLAIAIADFERMRAASGSPIEVPIRRDDPLAREWTLIVDSPGAQACLAAWEIPDARPPSDGDRRFEYVWSFDPATVADATAVAGALLSRLAPKLAARLANAHDRAATTTAATKFGSDLAARAVGYLGARV